ncbi:MAG: hypothetical protein WCK53_10610 [Methanomicrobiales archaeon]
MVARKISKEVLDHLPSDLHRLVADECFIQTGEWVVVEPRSGNGTVRRKDREDSA